MGVNFDAYLKQLDDVIAKDYDDLLGVAKNQEILRDCLTRYNENIPPGIEHAVLMRTRAWKKDGERASAVFSGTRYRLALQVDKTSACASQLLIKKINENTRVRPVDICGSCYGTGCASGASKKLPGDLANIESEEFAKEQLQLIESLRPILVGGIMVKIISHVRAQASRPDRFDWNILFQSQYSYASNGGAEFLLPIFGVGFPIPTPAPGEARIMMGNESIRISTACSNCRGSGCIEK